MAGNDLSGRKLDPGFVRFPAVDITAADSTVFDFEQDVPGRINIFPNSGDGDFIESQIPIWMRNQPGHHFHGLSPLWEFPALPCSGKGKTQKNITLFLGIDYRQLETQPERVGGIRTNKKIGL
jgi:hypothetical protein